MTKREIKSILNKVSKAKEKIRKLAAESEALRVDGQKLLDDLAKKECPFKKGQMFKAKGSAIWAKMTNVSAHKLHHGPIGEKYATAPYQIDCLRCTAKGSVQKGVYIFISGSDIGMWWNRV